jgi:hypothetical protein
MKLCRVLGGIQISVLLLAALAGTSAFARPSAEEAVAVRAAYPYSARVRDADGVRWTFTNHRLVETSFGPVLISEGRANEEDVAHVTSGRLDVTYLARVGGEFQVRRRFSEAVQVGSMGGIGEWTISYRFSSLPVIYAAGGFTGQGVTEGCTVLTELAPSGPHTVATIPDSYSTGGSGISPEEDVTGRIGNIVRDREFTVRYSGATRQVRRYVRRGDIYVRQGRPVLTHCGDER